MCIGPFGDALIGVADALVRTDVICGEHHLAAKGARFTLVDGTDAFLKDHGFRRLAGELFAEMREIEMHCAGDLVAEGFEIIGPVDVDDGVHIIVAEILAPIAGGDRLDVFHRNLGDMIFKHAFCFANEIVPIVHGGVGDVDLLAHAAQLVDFVAQFFRVKVKAVALHEDLHLFELEAHLLVIFDDGHEEQCFAAVVTIVVLAGNIVWRDEADLVVKAQRFFGNVADF